MPSNNDQPWGLVVPGRPGTPSEGAAQQYTRIGPIATQRVKTFDNGTCLEFGPDDPVDEFEPEHPFANQVAQIDTVIRDIRASRQRYEGINARQTYGPNREGDDGVTVIEEDPFINFRASTSGLHFLGIVELPSGTYTQVPSKYASCKNLISIYALPNKADTHGLQHPGDTDSRFGKGGKMTYAALPLKGDAGNGRNRAKQGTRLQKPFAKYQNQQRHPFPQPSDHRRQNLNPIYKPRYKQHRNLPFGRQIRASQSGLYDARQRSDLARQSRTYIENHIEPVDSQALAQTVPDPQDYDVFHSPTSQYSTSLGRSPDSDFSALASQSGRERLETLSQGGHVEGMASSELPPRHHTTRGMTDKHQRSVFAVSHAKASKEGSSRLLQSNTTYRPEPMLAGLEAAQLRDNIDVWSSIMPVSADSAEAVARGSQAVVYHSANSLPFSQSGQLLRPSTQMLSQVNDDTFSSEQFRGSSGLGPLFRSVDNGWPAFIDPVGFEERGRNARSHSQLTIRQRGISQPAADYPSIALSSVAADLTKVQSFSQLTSRPTTSAYKGPSSARGRGTRVASQLPPPTRAIFSLSVPGSRSASPSEFAANQFCQPGSEHPSSSVRSGVDTGQHSFSGESMNSEKYRRFSGQ